MQLSPLQSRLAASVIATVLLIALYFTLFSPQFALAADLEQPLPIILDDLDVNPDLDPGSCANDEARSLLGPTCEPEFAAFDRSVLGRAPIGVTSLVNNDPVSLNVDIGSTALFVFEVSGTPGQKRDDAKLELRGEDDAQEERAPSDASDAGGEPGLERRQSSRTVYISANTCLKPARKGGSKTDIEAPQLMLYVSTDPSNESPGPKGDSSSQVVFNFTEGAVMYNMTTNSDVYIGIHAANVSADFQGGYNCMVAASTDTFFHTYNVERDADLIWVDSDSQGALLITHNLTDSTDTVLQDRIMSTQPYVMFAHNEADKSINGVRHSYCGLQNYAQIAATKDGKFASMVQTGMTKRGPGNLPKQQFFFSGLNSSANYLGILAQEGKSSNDENDRAGSSVHVFRATSFSTKSNHGNCAIIQNLTFCDQVAYSVPSNPSFGNSTKLATFYDDYVKDVYSNFEKALAQVPCEAPNTQRYSLVRTCADCAEAYKNWLCSVAIPRCEDFSNSTDLYHPRALSQPFPNGEMLDAETLAKFPNHTSYNSSRNPRIDAFIKPGPYREVLPCDDLCYNLVQSCPSSLHFNCPRPKDAGFESSYATRENGQLACNYPGSAHVVSGGRTGVMETWVMGVSLGASLMMAVVL